MTARIATSSSSFGLDPDTPFIVTYMIGKSKIKAQALINTRATRGIGVGRVVNSRTWRPVAIASRFLRNPMFFREDSMQFRFRSPGRREGIFGLMSSCTLGGQGRKVLSAKASRSRCNDVRLRSRYTSLSQKDYNIPARLEYA
jgi:hypothetical protein